MRRRGTVKGWTGDLDTLEHLDKHGVLELAAEVADEEPGDTITADEFRDLLDREYYSFAPMRMTPERQAAIEALWATPPE